MRLQEVLDHNRDYVAGRIASPLPAAGQLPLAVVACYDPRLDGLLRGALGLVHTEAFLFRVAGALLRPDSQSLRSLANAVFFFGVSDVMVVGHTSCRMARFSATDYITAFRARGVSRDSFGSHDIREWAGAIASPRAGVIRSVDALAAAPYLPGDLLVAGVVLDDATGALDVVSPTASLADRRVMLPSFASESYASDANSDEVGSAPAGVATPDSARGGSEVKSTASRSGVGGAMNDLREFVRVLESTAGWKEELSRTRAEIAKEKSSLVKLELLERFLRRATVPLPKVATGQ